MAAPTPYTSSPTVTYALNAGVSSNINALLGTVSGGAGIKWGSAGAGTAASIYYSFPTSNAVSLWDQGTDAYFYGPTFETYAGFRGLSTTQQAAATTLIQSWASVANIAVNRVATETSTAVGDIRIAFTSDGYMEPYDYAYTYYPGDSYGGDIWINAVQPAESGNNYNPGGNGYHTILHELGHALGLGHPFDGAYSFTNPNYESYKYTVMSYSDVAGHADSGGSSFYPTTPMLLDIQALQYLYGANTNYNNGNNTYVFNGTTTYYQTLWDGGGTDAIQYNSTTGGTINLNAGEFSILGNAITLDSGLIQYDNVAIAYGVTIENATGGQGNDTILGNMVSNTLIGGAGNDTMIGGLGNDVYEVTDDGDVITESLNEGTDTVWSYVANYTMAANVENLYAPGGAARLIGNALNNIISANYGDNVIIGGAGNDTMIGGLGNDVYEVTDDGDVITESLNEGTDTVWSYVANYTMAANVENLYAPGGAARLIGNALNNIISANYGDNVIIGGAGNDTMIGGLGNDVYEVTDDGDVITESLNEGTDTVWSYVANYTMAANVENLYAPGGAARLIGNALNNIISANYGDNVIIGGAGNDTMIGGLGNDVYEVTEVGDVITELANQGGDTAWVYVNNYTLADNVETFYFGAAWLRGTGNALNNTMFGSIGNDVLIGAAGDDTMIGGSGNDTYSVLEAGDVVTELSGQGTDTVFTSVNNYVLASNVENLNVRAVATAGFTFTGNGLDNTIVGNDSDTTLIGGGGNDTISGGLGADTFRWSLADNGILNNPAIDRITDFSVSQNDSLDLRDLLQSESLLNLTNYLDIIVDASNTTFRISTTGDFAGGIYDANFENNRVVLESVDLFSVTATSSETDLLQSLISNNRLTIDV